MIHGSCPGEPEARRGPELVTDDLWPADLATRLLLKEPGQGRIPMKPLSTGQAGSMPLLGVVFMATTRGNPEYHYLCHFEGCGVIEANVPNNQHLVFLCLAIVIVGGFVCWLLWG